MIFHSDQGSQYASNDFVNLLKAFKVIQSMSRPGDVYDILFASYKLECVPNKGFARKLGRRRSNTPMPFTTGSAAGLSHPCKHAAGVS
jgi:transposase InsO family protein